MVGVRCFYFLCDHCCIHDLYLVVSHKRHHRLRLKLSLFQVAEVAACFFPMLNPSCKGSDHNSFHMLLSSSLQSLFFSQSSSTLFMVIFFFQVPFSFSNVSASILAYLLFAEESLIASSLVFNNRISRKSLGPKYDLYSLLAMSKSLAALGRGSSYSLFTSHFFLYFFW